MSRPGDPRHTRKWRTLATQVIADEPLCTLRLPGCTIVSTTADHIVPVSTDPTLAFERTNLRGSCASCNYARGDGHRDPTSTQPASRDW